MQHAVATPEPASLKWYFTNAAALSAFMMASTTEKEGKMIQEQLVCALCLDFLKEPKMLACAHSFCRDCLQKTSPRMQDNGAEPTALNDRRQSTGNESELEEDPEVLQCPSCHRNTELANGIESLSSPIRLTELLEAMSSQELEKGRVLLREKEKELNSLVERDDTELLPKCSEHGKAKEYFCNDCYELLCMRCMMDQHRTHDYAEAIKTLPGCLQSVRSVVQPAYELVRRVEVSLKQLVQDSESIEANRNICTEAIHEEFNKVRVAIDTREKMLLTTVNKYVDHKLTKVEHQSERLTKAKGKVEQIASRAEELLSESLCNLTALIEKDHLSEDLHNQYQSLAEVESEIFDSMFSSTYVGFRDDNIKAVQQQIGLLVSLCEFFPDADSGYYLSRKMTVEGEEDPYIQSVNNTRQEEEPCRPRSGTVGTNSRIEPIQEEPEEQEFCSNPKAIGNLVRSNSSPAIALKSILERRLSHDLIGSCPPVPIRFNSLRIKTPIIQPLKIIDKLCRSKKEVVHPCGICIGDNDCMIVSDVKNHCLRMIASNGKYIDSIGCEGKGSGEFEEPCALAVDHKRNILVAQRENPRIQKLTSSGKYSTKFGHKGLRGTSLGEPWGITVGPDHKIYVSDWDKNCIHVFHSNGRYDTIIGSDKFPSGGETLSLPAGIAVAVDGNLLVADRGSHCVWVLKTNGSVLSRIGSKGHAPGELFYPFGIAVDKEGNIIITESGNNRISVFSSSGAFLKHFGRKGSDPGMFHHPRHVCVNTKGELIVADELNHRLQLFKL